MDCNDMNSIVVPYPKVTLSERTHIYNDHPVIASKITLMSDINTPVTIFRMVAREVTVLLAAYALSSLEVVEEQVMTPIRKRVGVALADKIVLVAIERAGNEMEEGMRMVTPQARTGHCGLRRDKITKEPELYNWVMPKDIQNRNVFVLDPMLATGGSMNFTINKLKSIGCKKITVMSIIAAPQGIDLMQQHHPDVEMHIAYLDEGLNRNAYIVPGLGDAGDRLYGTGDD